MASSSSAAEEDKVRVKASHILIKHQQSNVKVSPLDPEGKAIIKRTKSQAVTTLGSLLEEIKSKKVTFEYVAERRSDCGSGKTGGDLGTFGNTQMPKKFWEATYALKVGEISDIVDTDSGVHIIKRTG